MYLVSGRSKLPAQLWPTSAPILVTTTLYWVCQSGNHCRGQKVPSYPGHLSFESLSHPLPPAPGFSIPSKTTLPPPHPPPRHTKPHWEWENLGAGVKSVHGRQTSFGVCTQANTDDKRNHKLSSWEPKAYFVFFTEEIKNLYTLPCLLQVKHLQDVLKPKTPSGFLQLLVLHPALCLSVPLSVSVSHFSHSLFIFTC